MRRCARLRGGRQRVPFWESVASLTRLPSCRQVRQRHRKSPNLAMSQASPWWTPDRHSDRRPFLLARGRIKAAIRHWFEAQGFIEVEPGCLQISPGNETHLHAFRTELIG